MSAGEENHTLPAPTNDSWRAWLMTGARRIRLDPRRLTGSHRGLKKILAEGLTAPTEKPSTWQEFSGAMVRHAVDDAMHSLPPEDTRLVKLAYFGGYSNREIAQHTGMAEGAVTRRLRRALAAISDQIQHGRDFGARAIYAILAFLSGKWLSEPAQHAWQAAMVTGAAAGAAVLIVSSQHAPAATPGQAAPGKTMAPQPSPTAGVVLPTGVPRLPVQLPSAVPVPTVKVPPLPVPSPSLPPLPPKIKNPL